MALIGGRTFEPFVQKRGVGHIFKGEPIFERLRYVCVSLEFMPIYVRALRCPLPLLVGQIVVWSHSHFKIG